MPSSEGYFTPTAQRSADERTADTPQPARRTLQRRRWPAASPWLAGGRSSHHLSSVRAGPLPGSAPPCRRRLARPALGLTAARLCSTLGRVHLHPGASVQPTPS